MFYLHHLSLCQEIPTKAGLVVLDPACWNETEGGSEIIQFKHALKSTSGHELKSSTEFVITDANVITPLAQLFKYLFFVISEIEYANEMPVNYSDEWDRSLKINDLISVGWCVYAFSEPAFLYGNYPVKFEGDQIILDKTFINKWGLIRNVELAKKVADKNNKNGDENDSHWRVLGICVDKNTFARLGEDVRE